MNQVDKHGKLQVLDSITKSSGDSNRGRGKNQEGFLKYRS